MSEQTVWKFAIPFPPKADTFEITMPAGARPLTLQMQSGEPTIWALVDPSAPDKVRRFRIAGTGHPINEDVAYVGTFQVAGGQLVFHIFEVIEPLPAAVEMKRAGALELPGLDGGS